MDAEKVRLESVTGKQDLAKSKEEFCINSTPKAHSEPHLIAIIDYQVYIFNKKSKL